MSSRQGVGMAGEGTGLLEWQRLITLERQGGSRLGPVSSSEYLRFGMQ